MARGRVSTRLAATQRSGVTFGDWKLIPLDGDNWELAHRHVSSKGKNVGRMQWNRVGRFYQSNTFHLALEYAADQEAKAGCMEAERDIREHLAEYRRILSEMRGEMHG